MVGKAPTMNACQYLATCIPAALELLAEVASQPAGCDALARVSLQDGGDGSGGNGGDGHDGMGRYTGISVIAGLLPSRWSLRMMRELATHSKLCRDQICAAPFVRPLATAVYSVLLPAAALSDATSSARLPVLVASLVGEGSRGLAALGLVESLAGSKAFCAELAACGSRNDAGSHSAAPDGTSLTHLLEYCSSGATQPHAFRGAARRAVTALRHNRSILQAQLDRAYWASAITDD
eukprot:g18.t1